MWILVRRDTELYVHTYAYIYVYICIYIYIYCTVYWHSFREICTFFNPPVVSSMNELDRPHMLTYVVASSCLAVAFGRHVLYVRSCTVRHKHWEWHCLGMDGAEYCNSLSAIRICMCSRRARTVLHCIAIESVVCVEGVWLCLWFKWMLLRGMKWSGALSHSHVTQLCVLCNQAFPTVAAITTNTRCSP